MVRAIDLNKEYNDVTKNPMSANPKSASLRGSCLNKAVKAKLRAQSDFGSLLFQGY
jgi:hypothetical protein